MQRAVDCADWSRWRGFKVSYRAVIPDAVIPGAVIPDAVIPGMVIAAAVLVDAGNPFRGQQ
jgi:hypothetical protein